MDELRSKFLSFNGFSDFCKFAHESIQSKSLSQRNYEKLFIKILVRGRSKRKTGDVAYRCEVKLFEFSDSENFESSGSLTFYIDLIAKYVEDKIMLSPKQKPFNLVKEMLEEMSAIKDGEISYAFLGASHHASVKISTSDL